MQRAQRAAGSAASTVQRLRPNRQWVKRHLNPPSRILNNEAARKHPTSFPLGAVGSLEHTLNVSDEVSHALATNTPVVALESTIYTHGAMTKPLGLEDIVRANGAVPAVVGILAGVPTVGLSPQEIERMVNESPKKASRRDLAYLVAMGKLGREIHAGTTIAGTALLANLAGIRVFGTGGLGGVHRDGQNSMDISADLTELGRTRMGVVCSGSKGFLDIPRTLEYLETQGVHVSTFSDGRDGEVDFPAFWARDSGVRSPMTIQTEEEAAATILSQEILNINSGLIFANPIPEEFSIPKNEMDAVIEQAVKEAAESGAQGNENTPFILRRIAELTQGRSVPANWELVRANVARAAKIAGAVSRLISGEIPCHSPLPLHSRPCQPKRVLVSGARFEPQWRDVSRMCNRHGLSMPVKAQNLGLYRGTDNKEDNKVKPGYGTALQFATSEATVLAIRNLNGLRTKFGILKAESWTKNLNKIYKQATREEASRLSERKPTQGKGEATPWEEYKRRSQEKREKAKGEKASPVTVPGEVGKPEAGTRSDVMVAGSVAVDLSCDYAGQNVSHNASPRLHTSNPAQIGQSIGGVGRNVALAAHSVSPRGSVKLCSMVGDDLAGSTVLASLESNGMDVSCVQQLKSNRTAQFIAVNDGNKNLMLAMADMEILTSQPFSADWETALAKCSPKWLVVDGNWSDRDIGNWIRIGKQNRSKIAFEPVSIEKSARLFPPHKLEGREPLGVFPNASVDLASPNQYELEAMHAAAQGNEYFEDAQWWGVIDAFGMRGARDRYVGLTSTAMTDAGIPQQAVRLLPYIPTIITKVGSQGALLTTILKKDDPLLHDPASKRFILSRSQIEESEVGGIYMRLFPPVERVEEKDVVSVNGVGDTFLGVLIAGLSRGGSGSSVEKLIDVAQKGAVMTLRSRESVSPQLGQLRGELDAACALTPSASE